VVQNVGVAVRRVRWVVDRSTAIEPVSGGECDAAYVVKLSCGEVVRELVVEFAAPSAVVSCSYAEEVARRFRHDDDLPRHVVLEQGGTVRVVAGADFSGQEEERQPREAAAVAAPGGLPGSRLPG
jgi:hypothetical protein